MQLDNINYNGLDLVQKIVLAKITSLMLHMKFKALQNWFSEYSTALYLYLLLNGPIICTFYNYYGVRMVNLLNCSGFLGHLTTDIVPFSQWQKVFFRQFKGKNKQFKEQK